MSIKFKTIFLVALIAFAAVGVAVSVDSERIYSDKEIPGGSGRRQVDVTLSEKFGGYRSEEAQQAGKASSIYGNYIEPVAHAAEHTARAAIAGGNAAEWARAKDELKTVGNGGLLTNEHHYQSAAQKK